MAVCPVSNSQSVGPPLLICPWLLIQHIQTSGGLLPQRSLHAVVKRGPINVQESPRTNTPGKRGTCRKSVKQETHILYYITKGFASRITVICSLWIIITPVYGSRHCHCFIAIEFVTTSFCTLYRPPKCLARGFFLCNLLLVCLMTIMHW